jgi:hypothetical protein
MSTDPTTYCQYVGYVNSNTFSLGTLNIFERSCMFRGVQTTPVAEKYAGTMYRGWNANFEFAYRVNWVGTPVNGAIGWDIVIPQSGWNVKAWTPGGGGTKDEYSQPLKHENSKIANPLALPTGVTAGQKVAAMVRIVDPDGGAAIQRAAGMPIPLNDDGSGRDAAASPPVLVYRYQTQNSMSFSSFGLRLT